jgi:subtilisin family serine protease
MRLHLIRDFVFFFGAQVHLVLVDLKQKWDWRRNKFMMKYFCVFLFLFFHGLLPAAGLYGSYIVRLKESSAPRAPGGRVSVSSMKERAGQLINSFTHRLGLSDSAEAGTGGPRSAASARVRSTQNLWIANSVSMSIRRDYVSEIEAMPEVQEVVPDELVFLSVPVETATEGSRPGFEALHKQGLDGRGVRIGVIDSGIIEHQDFSGAVRAYRDFTLSPSDSQTDSFGHGTHVSSIIAGRGVSGEVRGVAPAAELVVARVLEPVPMDGTEQDGMKRMQAFASRLLAAMQWMIDPDENPQTNDYPRVINNSWGFGVSVPLSAGFFDRAIASWRDLGIIPVFAAGNEGGRGNNSIYYPASSSHVIAVGALKDNERAFFSSIGGDRQEKPDFMMGGYAIRGLRTSPSGALYGPMSGTSQAAPLLSGLVALMLQLNPGADYDSIYNCLRDASTDLGVPGWDAHYGWGFPAPEQVLEKWREIVQFKLQAGGEDTFDEYERLYLEHYENGNREALVSLRELENAYYRFVEKELNEKIPSLALYRWLQELERRKNSSPRAFRALSKLIAGRVRYLSQ